MRGAAAIARRAAALLLVGCVVTACPLGSRRGHAEEPPAAGPATPKQAPTLDNARRLAREGSLPAAITALRGLTSQHPDDAAAGRLLQDLLVQLGRSGVLATTVPEKAGDVVANGLKARIRLLESAPGDAKGLAATFAALLKRPGAPDVFRLDLAAAQQALGRASTAEAELRRYLESHPDDPAGLTALGRVLVVRKKKLAAKATFARALAGNPGLAAPAVALARLHAQAGDAKAARSVLRTALARYPHQPLLVRALAEDQILVGEHDLALRTLGSLLGLAAEKSDVHARMAEVHRLRRALPDAERCARAALAVAPTMARAWRVVGFVKQKTGDLPAALDAYQKAVASAPAWAQIQADLGFVQFLMGQHLFAERTLQKALALDDDLLDAHLYNGMVLFFRERPKPARKELLWVLKRAPDDVRALRAMGYLLLDEGKAKNALKYFLQVAELDPRDARSMRMAGRCHLAVGKVDDAIDAIREAITRDGKYGFAYFDLGKALERQEKWADAAAAYRKAIELDKTLPHPHLYLAELLDGVLDDAKAALPHYQAYLDLGGHKEGGWIKKRIEQLKRL